MTTKPNIELKKLKIADHLSEETTAYSADVYVDGALFCYARNSGHGGCDQFDPPNRTTYHSFNENLKALDERIAAHYPPMMWDGRKLKDADLEMMIGRLMDDYEIDKSIRNKLSRKWVFVTKDGVHEMKRNKGEDADKLLIALNDRYPGCQLLNKLSLPEVRKVFGDHGLLEAA